MCASYGLGGGSRGEPDFAFFDEGEHRGQILRGWIEERGGKAAITGRIARNLNPVILNTGLELAWWSLPRPSGGTAFNSRDDSLMRYWKDPFQRRGLLPASWYVEKKVRFGLPTGEAFGIAAVTSSMIDDTGAELTAYSMVTSAAVGEAATVHDRMSLVLPPSAHQAWLDPGRAGDAALVKWAQRESVEISGAMTRADDRLF